MEVSNLTRITSQLIFDLQEPDNIQINDDSVGSGITRDLKVEEWEAVISNSAIQVWMGNYTVDSLITVGDGEKVTFEDLFRSMKNFLERKVTEEERNWFEENILNNSAMSRFYINGKTRDNLKVKDLYVDSCFFVGPMEPLKKDYTESSHRKRIVKKGTYVFGIES